MNKLEKEADLCFQVFMEKGENLLKEKGECDEADNIKETIEDILQNYQSFVKEFNSMNSNFSLKKIKIALDNQNQGTFERFDEFSHSTLNLKEPTTKEQRKEQRKEFDWNGDVATRVDMRTTKVKFFKKYLSEGMSDPGKIIRPGR